MSQDKQSVILINKQPIMKFIVDGLNSCKFGHDAIEILAELEYAPTIDAAPVVHGHWIWYKNHWECSVCRNNRFTNDIVLGLNAAYCSYCGAKMDGGEE